jgi:hypothetical protein
VSCAVLRVWWEFSSKLAFTHGNKMYGMENEVGTIRRTPLKLVLDISQLE